MGARHVQSRSDRALGPGARLAAPAQVQHKQQWAPIGKLASRIKCNCLIRLLTLAANGLCAGPIGGQLEAVRWRTDSAVSLLVYLLAPALADEWRAWNWRNLFIMYKCWRTQSIYRPDGLLTGGLTNANE